MVLVRLNNLSYCTEVCKKKAEIYIHNGITLYRVLLCSVFRYFTMLNWNTFDKQRP